MPNYFYPFGNTNDYSIRVVTPSKYDVEKFEGDSITGVRAYCQNESCSGRRLMYEPDRKRYVCLSCGRGWPYDPYVPNDSFRYIDTNGKTIDRKNLKFPTPPADALEQQQYSTTTQGAPFTYGPLGEGQGLGLNPANKSTRQHPHFSMPIQTSPPRSVMSMPHPEDMATMSIEDKKSLGLIDDESIRREEIGITSYEETVKIGQSPNIKNALDEYQMLMQKRNRENLRRFTESQRRHAEMEYYNNNRRRSFYGGYYPPPS